MKCAQCRNGIAKQDERKAKIVFENGKLKAAYHRNCYATKQRIELMIATKRMPQNAYEVKGNNQDDKAAQERLKDAEARLQAMYGEEVSKEVLALAERQVEIAKEAVQEERREGWDDYRDTGTAEV